MGAHSGKLSKFKVGANFIGGLRGIDWKDSIDTVDLTAAGDTAKSHDTTYSGWDATAECLLDHADTAQAAVSVGDSVAIEMYSEGDATGKVYYSGTATITEINWGSSHTGEATVKYTLLGQGALSGPTTVA